MDFRQLLKENRYIFFDGGMGTMLQAKGMKIGAIPELLNLENPDWIIDIHKMYINAGADVIYANTFGANAYKLKGTGKSVSEIISAGIKNAREACKGTDTLVALDIGPIGQLLEPTGTLKFEEAYEIYKEQLIAGKDADLVVFETQTDLYELKAAVLAAKENTDLPIVCTMTFEKNHRTFTGCGITNMAYTLDGLGVDAMGVNCSLGPEDLYDVIDELSQNNGIEYLTTSAKTKYQIDALFTIIGGELYEYLKKKKNNKDESNSPKIKVLARTNVNKKKGCC